ncbi:hypothetical protein PHLCEN_2v4404 [Hermanssonia centrifuga]|uniref:Uncharacterized protein n=1 Tax=Hermanssonia centrifuga TaxID=98765 RepID=A0A2R6PNQ8_9APHY|nr:hypothetical protein PHLCEN_2v4404 [Hermanssonia centrifuga]
MHPRRQPRTPSCSQRNTRFVELERQTNYIQNEVERMRDESILMRKETKAMMMEVASWMDDDLAFERDDEQASTSALSQSMQEPSIQTQPDVSDKVHVPQENAGDLKMHNADVFGWDSGSDLAAERSLECKEQDLPMRLDILCAMAMDISQQLDSGFLDGETSGRQLPSTPKSCIRDKETRSKYGELHGEDGSTKGFKKRGNTPSSAAKNVRFVVSKTALTPGRKGR